MQILPLQVIVIAGQSNAQGWMGDGTQYPKNTADETIPFRKDLLTKLISELRKKWQEPALPVVLGMDEQHPGPVARPQVVEAQKAIAKADPHVEWTSMTGLEKADISHLTNAGLLKHGERIAEAMARLWEKKSARQASVRFQGESPFRQSNQVRIVHPQ